MARPSRSPLKRQLFEVRRALSVLDRSLGRLAASLNGLGSARATKPRQSRRLSPRARAALKLQGRYMGYMRQLKPGQKAQVRAIKESKGIELAIRRAQALAGKRTAA